MVKHLNEMTIHKVVKTDAKVSYAVFKSCIKMPY